MDSNSFWKKWRKSFVPAITWEQLTACCNEDLYWEVFPFMMRQDARLLSGEEAKAAYTRANKDGAFCIRTYNYKDTETSLLPEKYFDAKQANRVHELYVVASDWSWTYVSTHENDWFGPYFCKRAIPEYEKYDRNYK